MHIQNPTVVPESLLSLVEANCRFRVEMLTLPFHPKTLSGLLDFCFTEALFFVNCLTKHLNAGEGSGKVKKRTQRYTGGALRLRTRRRRVAFAKRKVMVKTSSIM